MDFACLLPYAVPATALTAFGLGLDALGVNVLKMLQLASLKKPLQLLVGAAGVVVLAASGFNFSAGLFAPQTLMTVCAVAAVGVGLAGVGVNLLTTLKLGSLRKPLQYVVGLCGAYCLLVYFGVLVK